ncbi:ABC transporter ATP-binding protein/permease [Acholeplasma granularum]|uniref:ABC transporter ATP-binding protein/permease n=1 Tax=Acholeplasma granularum TaxID=264635 RepID=UPI000471DF72|nr:ABC transporter ATP-binding protein/permease [Acholeplasma granularum]
MIKVRNLDKHFNRGKKNSIHVLNDVSLTFPEKGLVVLLGPSGSGKTTLLNVIGGLDKVQKGEMEVFNHHIKHYNSQFWDKIRTEEIGYIFQNYYLQPNLNVFDNIAFVLKMLGIYDKEEIKKRVDYILKQVGMYRFRKKLSTQLSGGQQQRVAIARALVKNPKVIIADEPTGNLDSKNTLEIMNIIKSISLNKLVVLVTHEKEIAQFYGDRIIELKDGKIINDTTNQSNNDHDFTNDNIIYLKDLKNISNYKDNQLSTSLYSDSNEETKTEVRLIIKNRTLYLDINSDIDKIQLINNDSHLKVLDEHFTKKTRKEMLETTFDDTVLDHNNVNKKKRLTISIKNSFWIAFKRLLNFGRKGKLMMVIFALSGMLVAFSTINIYSILRRDYHDMLVIDERYIEVKKDEFYSTNGSTNGILAQLDNFNEPYKIASNRNLNNAVGIYLGNGYYKELPSSIRIEYAEQLTLNDLYYGTLPVNDDEIVISYGIYSQNSFQDMNYQEIGIWSAKDFIGEKISYMNDSLAILKNYKIVGISKVNYLSIYTNSYNEALDLIDRNISLTEEQIEPYIINSNTQSVFIFTINNHKLFNSLKTTGYDVVLTSQNAIDTNNMLIAQDLASNMFMSIFLIGGGLLAFFFVMRSSMISRIYEISVYRALGVRKYEIYSSFSVEIVLLTFVSSFVGFIFMTIILGSISNSPLGSFLKYQIDFIVIILGTLFLFASNLVIGLLPMGLLLRKTPAQIISSYDI